MSLSRLVTLVAALAMLALTLSCATNFARSKSAPIVPVVVENGRAVPHPTEIPVHARAGKGPDDQPVPSVVNWFGPKGQKLMIEMKDPNQVCFRQEGPRNDGIFCNGNHCFAATNVDFRQDVPARCEYRVWIDGVTQPYDPVVIVDNCCDTASVQ